jgi:diguanylate cyclase (GGDEF)-like protein/PAS domain S-box-containing protein
MGNFIHTDASLDHAHEVLAEIEATQATIADAENAVRGYVITGDESYRTLYQAVVPRITESIGRLSDSTADNPGKQANVADLKQKTNARLRTLEQVVEARRSSGFGAAQQIVSTGIGLAQMDAVRRVLSEMRDEESSLMKERETRFMMGSQGTIVMFMCLTLLICTLFIAIYYMIRRDITSRKAAVEALQESEERFRRLSEAAFEGIAVHQNGRIIEANQTMSAMSGYEPDELIGMSALDLVAPECREVAQRNITEGNEKPYEIMGQRKDGSTFPMEARGTAIPYKGSAARVTAMRDITERKRAEEAVRESERRHRQLVNQASDGILLFDWRGNVVDANPAACRALGYTRPELQQLNTRHFVPKAHLSATLRAVKEMREGSALLTECQLRRKDGTLFAVEISTSVLGGGHLQVIARDITQRKVAEDALRESEERNRTLLAALPQRVFFKDRQSTFVSVNRLFAGDLGMTPEEVVGKTDYDLHSREFADNYRADELRIMSSGKAEVREQVNMQIGGSVRTIEVIKAPVIGDDGIVMGILGLYTDISKRKRAEEALRESEERYSSVVAALEEGVILQSADGGISATNASAERLLGITPSRIEGQKSFYKMWLSIHEDGTPFPEEEYPAHITLRTGSPCSNVVMGIHKPDGSLVWLSVNSQPLVKPGEAKAYAVVSSFTDITERKRTEKALLELTIRDALTGLYNRREMDRLLEEETDRQRRHGGQLSLVMLDIDDFKKINDTYGHRVGDEVLRWIAALAQRNVRPADRVARYGGEEFALILPETSEEEAFILAQRIRRAVVAKAFQFAQPGGGHLRVAVTASLGVATMSPGIMRADDLTAAADDALYEAKRSGRNRVVCAPPPVESVLLTH